MIASLMEHCHKVATAVAGKHDDEYLSVANQVLTEELPRLPRNPAAAKAYLTLAVRRAVVRFRKAERKRTAVVSLGPVDSEIEPACHRNGHDTVEVLRGMIANLPSCRDRQLATEAIINGTARNKMSNAGYGSHSAIDLRLGRIREGLAAMV